MLALREACQHEKHSARLWTLYGVSCLRVRRVEDARRALGQALWLRERAKDEPRADVTRKLLEQIEHDSSPRLPLSAA